MKLVYLQITMNLIADSFQDKKAGDIWFNTMIKSGSVKSTSNGVNYLLIQ